MIAEKLTTIAENQQKVYDAGFTAGQTQGGGGSYDQGYTDGKQAEHDRFWDAFQQGGTRTSYNSAFEGSYWTDEAFKPKYDLNVLYAPYMFQNSSITNLKQLLLDSGVTLDVSNATSFTYAFSNSKVTHVPFLNFAKATQINYLFRGCKDLKEVSMFVIDGANFTYTFGNCESLTDLTITGSINTGLSLPNSPLLSMESVQSIIDCLKDLTGATAQTLQLHKDVGNKLTDEQKATITAKNWNVSY